jgi:hypothetical protein
MKLKFNSIAKKRFAAWLAATATMPFSAYPLVSQSVSLSDLDLPMITIFGICWALVSGVFFIFIKENVH